MHAGKEHNHHTPGILKFTAVKTTKTRIKKVNYLTENTLHFHNKGQNIDVLLEGKVKVKFTLELATKAQRVLDL